MTIEIKKNNQETIIEVVGRLDTITAPALDKTIKDIILKSTGGYRYPRCCFRQSYCRYVQRQNA